MGTLRRLRQASIAGTIGEWLERYRLGMFMWCRYGQQSGGSGGCRLVKSLKIAGPLRWGGTTAWLAWEHVMEGVETRLLGAICNKGVIVCKSQC